MPETTKKLKDVLGGLVTNPALSSDEINQINGLGEKLIKAAEGLQQSLERSAVQNTQSLKIPLEKMLTLPASQQAIDSALKPAVQKMADVLSEKLEGMLKENQNNRKKMLDELNDLSPFSSKVPGRGNSG